MKDEYQKTVDELTGCLSCSKHFHCVKSGYEKLCKVKDIGLESYLECLDETPQECSFALSFGNSYFCTCPLRIFIKKKLKK